jgi:diguanylate cyclase (GGDEF)-like protein
LSNRRQLNYLLDREIQRSRRFGHDLSVILIDLDDFKAINDSHGHAVGDEVLKHVAQLVGAESRASDEPARYGGEEFMVTLPETAIDGAAVQAERIRKRIEESSCDTAAGALSITVSVGVAGSPGQPAEASALFDAADAALYEAKRGGKNCLAEAPLSESMPAAGWQVA